ncbi:MAG: putative transcriptional regulator [Firmicutes bacterium]|nr:putative transcriptional regulator [Bacillota bacterium]
MQTVGELLRDEREKKGLSVKEIESAISIRSFYINAIEEGNYNLVPGEVYLKGFIRNYANYLGLNGQEMVDLYRQSQKPIPSATVDISPDTIETSANKSEQPSKNNKNSNKLLMISLLAVCVAGSAWWLLTSPKQATEPQTNKQIETNPTPPSQPQPPQSVIPPAPTNPVVITAKYTEKCWTSVTADGKIIYEGTPLNGDTITWEAQKNITITAGNAGGIDLISNGQSIGKMGAKGEVVVKTFVAKQ